MADIIQTREVLKEYFQTGDIPTEPQYRNLIESLRHVHDKIPLEGLNLEGYDEEGEKDNNLYVRLGDFFNASNGTKIIIDDTEATISFKGKLKSEDDIDAIGRTITAGSFIGDGSQLTNLPVTTLPLNIAYTDTDNEFVAAQTIVNSAPAFNLKDANAASTSDISGYLYFRDSSNTSGAYLGMANDNLELWSRNGYINLKVRTEFDAYTKFKDQVEIGDNNTASIIIADDNLGGDSGMFRRDNDGVFAATFSDGRFGYGGIGYDTVLNIKDNQVGIGVGNNTPTSLLDVNGDANFGGDVFIRKDEATLTLSKADTDQYLKLVGGSGTNSDVIAQRTLTLQALNGDIQLASTNSISLDTNAASRYEIDSSGNHDFKNGTATFGGALNLQSDLNITSSYPRIRLTDTDNDDWSLINNNGEFIIHDDTNSAVLTKWIGSTKELRHRGFVNIETNTTDSDVAKLVLTNRDLSVIDEQELSSIEFYNSDADGGHTSAYIKNVAAETYGRKGQLVFGVTRTNSTNAEEVARFDEAGVLRLQEFASGEGFLAQTGSDSTYLNSVGVEFRRGTSYLRPITNNTHQLFVGGFSDGNQNWTNINFRSNGQFRINDEDILHTGNISGHLPNNLAYTDTDNNFIASQTIENYLHIRGSDAGGAIGFNRNTDNGTILNPLYGAFQLQTITSGELQLQRYDASGASLGNALTIDLDTGSTNFFGAVNANAGADITGTLTTSGLISSNTGIRAINGADYATLHDYGVDFNRYMNYLRPTSGSVKTLRIGGAIKGDNDWGDVYVYTTGTDDFRWNDSVIATHAHVTSEINNTTLQKVTENANTTDRGIVINSGGLDVTGDTNFQNTVDINGVLSTNAGLYITGGSFISNQAQLYQAANLGLVISGQSGSTNDLTIVNSAGNTIMQTPTGSRAANFSSTLSTAGVITANAGINATGHVDITGNYKIGGVSVLTGNTTLQVGSAGGTGAINLATTSGNAISIAGLNSTFNGSITATGQTITASNFAGNWNGKSTSDFIEKPTLSSFFSNERYGLEYYPVANDTSIVSGGWARHLAFKAGKGGTNHAQFGALGHEDSLTYAFIAVQANAYNSANTFRVYEDKVSWGDNDIYHQGNFIAGTDYVSISGNETITGEKYFSSVRFSDFATLNFANRLEIYSSSGSTKLNLLQGNLVVQNNGASTDISINPVSGIISASNFLGNWNGKTDSYFVNTQESQTIFGAKTFNAGLTSHGTGTFNSTLLASGGLIATTGTFTDDIQSNSLIKMLSNGNDGSAMMVFKLASSVDWVYSQKGTGTSSGLELKAVDHTNYYHYAAASYFGDSVDESNHLVLDHSLKTASLTGELTATGNVTASDFVGNWNGKAESDFMRTTGNVTETITGDKSFSGHVITMEYDLEVDGGLNVATSTNIGGSARATDFRLMSLNTAPSSSTDTGTTGEIRYTADYIYVCTATNTWKRVALSTW